jgi:glucans biosynthesis protein
MRQAAAQTQGLAEGSRFSREALESAAADLAKAPFVAPEATLPAGLQDLDAVAYDAIRFRAERAIWSTEQRGFTIELLHRGFVFATPVDLFTVEDGRVLRIPYDPSLFDFGKLTPPQPDEVVGFSGFRLAAQTDGTTTSVPIAIFQGATFFRAVAAGQVFGQAARGLALDVGDANGEEFPIFRAFWIERPEAGASEIRVHALLDSEAAAGAYTVTIRPGGAVTAMDVEFTLYPRVEIRHVGIAPSNAMFYFDRNDFQGIDDTRLAAHDASGLQMLNGGGEWIWRPLQNPTTLQISAFVDKDPRGFGLLQRNRDPAAFEDARAGYERMPSLWVEPLDAWGPGTVQLVEIPTDSDVNDNIITYWRPQEPLQAATVHRFRYRLSWCWEPPGVPVLAMATATRSGRAAGSNRRFVVDFRGEIFKDAERSKALAATATVSPGKILEQTLTVLPDRGMARLSFVLDPDGQVLAELRAQILENNVPVSETWLYRWTV